MSSRDVETAQSLVEAVDVGDVGVLVLGREGRVLAGDDTATELLGREVPPEGADRVTDLGLRAVEGELLDRLPEETVQCRVTTPASEAPPLSVRATPVDGREQRLLLFLRPAATEPSTGSPVDFQAIAEVSFELIFRVDTDGELTFLSNAARSVLDASPGEIEGRHFADFVHEADLGAAVEAFEAALAGESTLGLDLRLETVASTVRHTELNVTPVHRNGEVVGVTGVVRDVTDRRERLRSLERLERVNETIREVDRALIDAETRIETLRLVCERLADATAYTLAWFGEPVDGRLEPTTWSGEDTSYLADLSLDPADPAQASLPACRAFEEGRVVVAEADADRDESGSGNRRVTAAVPVSHDGTRYGVLGLHALRSAAFDARERDALAEMGDSIGHALSMASTREDARLFRELVDQSGDGVYVLDPEDGTIVDANDTVFDRLGYDRETLVGRTIWSVARQSTSPAGAADTESAVGTENPDFAALAARIPPDGSLELAGHHERADGSTFPVETKLTRGTLPSGREYVVAVARDVSERQAAEARARREAELFEAIVENVPVVAFRLGPDGEFRRWAGAGLERIPDRFELEGLTLAELDSIAPELAANCRRALDGESLLRTVGFLGREWRSWYRPVERDGEPRGAVGFALDVTDRHRREEMIEVLDRVLRHNLRNDMNIILAAAQRIADGEGDPERAAARVRETTDDLLELADTARDIRGVVDPDRDRDYGAVDPASVVTTACDRAEADGATVRAAVDGDLPTVPDPGLELAIRELVDNAVEHAGAAPTVEVSVGVDPGADEDEQVRVRVADDGPGLPEMEQRVLTGRRETPLQHGQGLGLWLVYWVVREAGGDLSVTVADGTAVELRLPVAD